jgi:predicted AlkP superfamily pyrophosphatase or phosphodiesterase
MTFRRLLQFICLLVLVLVFVPLAARSAERPRLVLVVAVDQFRYDYLKRYASDKPGGFARMLGEGAVFHEAYFEHFPTVTAIGHATMLSGATPAVHGIVGNSWFDRAENEEITSVSDKSVPLLGAAGGTASSPRQLLVGGLGDEVKAALGPESKVIGISMKDRAAILGAGRGADAAYWYDPATGNFISSGYYFDKLPGWVKEFNRGSAAERYAGREWKASTDGASFGSLDQRLGKTYYDGLRTTPFGNDLVAEFARAAVGAEQLGKDNATDILLVSFSSNDYIGHRWGPDSPQVRDISVRTDQMLAEFFEFFNSAVGLDHTMIVFTGDHGVAPVPEEAEGRKLSAGRMSENAIATAIDKHLDKLYGEADWVIGKSGPLPYLDHQLITKRKLDPVEVRRKAAQTLRDLPHVLRVYTFDELASGRALVDHIDRRVANGFHAQRAADLFVVLEPYWMFSSSGTTHGSPHQYDAHVPLVFLGRGVKPGHHYGTVAINDIAPTLAAILGIEPPPGATGRVLQDALAQ